MKKLYITIWLVILITSVNSQINTKTSKATVAEGIKIILSSPTDYFRSFQSGVWDDPNIWESSPDNMNWAPATLTPDFLANSITIRDPDSVNIISSIEVDQVLIYGGAVLNHVAGVLIVRDGTGADIDNNGTFMLSSASNPPQFSGSDPRINIATGGVLRVSAAGMTGAGTGVNANNYVYNNNSVLEYTLTGAFSTANVTYFPNVGATTIPIFRVTANSPTVMNVGSTSQTTFNGLFQITGTATVRWQNSGNRFFRNGIENVGPMDFEAASIGASLFHINGSTAILGGSGSLLVPNAGLQIASGTTADMSSDKTVTGSISLLTTNSEIVLNVFDLTVSGSISITDSSSFVKTNSSGALMLNNVGAIGKLFPVGYSSINPLYIQSPVTTSYSARVVEPITPPIYNDNRAVLCTWNISSPLGSSGVSIGFGYAYPPDAGPFYNNAGPVEVGVYIGGTWNIHQTGLFPVPFSFVNGTYAVGVSAVNTMNGPTNEFPFVVANIGAILARDHLIYCFAQKQNGDAIINWKILDADNVSQFEVQRSVNGSNYQPIAAVSPSPNQTDYSYIDAALSKGVLLYRIKVNRINGVARYSNTVAIINDSHGFLITSITPNPIINHAEIVLSSAKPAGISFIVYDISGKQVNKWISNIHEGTNYLSVDLSSLPPGIYHLLATTPDSRIVQRFVKQ